MKNIKLITSIALLSIASTCPCKAMERDAADYYFAHLSEYKGKEIRILCRNPSVVGETKIKPGYVDVYLSTENSPIHCLVKNDRVDALVSRVKSFPDGYYLMGTLEITENGNPYLLLEHF